MTSKCRPQLSRHNWADEVDSAGAESARGGITGHVSLAHGLLHVLAPVLSGAVGQQRLDVLVDSRARLLQLTKKRKDPR